MNKAALVIAYIIIISNVLIGHFFASTGLMTPVILPIVTALTCFKTKEINPILLSIFTFGLIVIHDIGIKLYPGGSPDGEGLGWYHLLLFLGLIPSYILLTYTIFKDCKHRLTEMIIAAIIFPILIAGHLYLFSGLGLDR